MLQRADTNDVRYAYRLILGREPDEGGAGVIQSMGARGRCDTCDLG